MRKTVCMLICLIFSQISFGQESREFEMTEDDTSYVMKKYFLCIYERGTERNQAQIEVDSIQDAHLNHINTMAREGYVIIAGPFETTEDSHFRGILIFDVEKAEIASKLVAEDPAVLAGRLKFRILPWWTAKGACLN